MPDFFYGRGERTQTFDLSVPNRARYQLRHTPICEVNTRAIISYLNGYENRLRYATVTIDGTS